MPLQIIHRDITLMHCDAIVNPTDPYYSGSGGTDFAIHSAAGEELSSVCRALPPAECGQAVVTPGFKLDCRHIIHTVGPVWTGGDKNEEMLLRSCYINSLIRAVKLGAQSLAFPLISAGTFGFPKDRVLRIATDAISDFLLSFEQDMEVYICILDRNAFEPLEEDSLLRYLGESIHPSRNARRDGLNRPRPSSRSDMDDDVLCSFSMRDEAALDRESFFAHSDEPPAPKAVSIPPDMPKLMPSCFSKLKSLKTIALHDDSFAVLLLKLIDQKGMSDVQCYKKANVSKGTFWKINNDPKYRPSKPTVIAFAIALELSLEETDKLLRSAGFALSGNNYFDVIIEFYIGNGIYDIFEINAALFKYDQVCLGC